MWNLPMARLSFECKIKRRIQTGDDWSSINMIPPSGREAALADSSARLPHRCSSDVPVLSRGPGSAADSVAEEVCSMVEKEVSGREHRGVWHKSVWSASFPDGRSRNKPPQREDAPGRSDDDGKRATADREKVPQLCPAPVVSPRSPVPLPWASPPSRSYPPGGNVAELGPLPDRPGCARACFVE